MKNKTLYVVYSHTDYLDVLEIQTDYLNDYPNKILLINKTKDLDIFDEYKKVIFYDDDLPYMSRLLALDILEEDVFIFRHESDIPIKRDDDVVEKMAKCLIENELDRIDLQCEFKGDNPNTERINIIDDIEIVRQKNIRRFIFNVNPAIWRKSAFMNVHNKYKKLTFHQSETGTIQQHCANLNFYKLWTDEIIYSGHFKCIKPIQNFHITAGGKWFPLRGIWHPDGTFCFQDNSSLLDEYDDIINKYNLKNGKREFG